MLLGSFIFFTASGGIIAYRAAEMLFQTCENAPARAKPAAGEQKSARMEHHFPARVCYTQNEKARADAGRAFEPNIDMKRVIAVRNGPPGSGGDAEERVTKPTRPAL